MFKGTEEIFPEAEVRKESLRYGAYLGVISFAIGIASTYLLMGVSNFLVASMVSGTLAIVVFLGLAVYFSVLLRKAANGYWSFSQALKMIFTMLVVVSLINPVGTAAFNAIDPEPQQRVIDRTIAASMENLQKWGADDETIEKQMAGLEQQREDARTFSIGRTLKALAISLIMYFVLALILAAIFKKERPMAFGGGAM